MRNRQLLAHLMSHARLSVLAGVVRRTLRGVGRWVVATMPDSRLSARSYYAVTGVFDREHTAVLAGRKLHNEQAAQGSSYVLRRNAHRLEKGLLMRPRRSVFATEYIEQTVKEYAHSVTQETATIDADELAWVRDVLDMYFSVVGDHPAIVRAHQAFAATHASVIATPQQGCTRTPYRRAAAWSDVTFEQMQSLSRRRRSVRWFDGRMPERDLIDSALEVALQAPSACNRQPFEFRIYDDPALVGQVMGIPMGAGGYAHNVPMAVVITGQLRAFFSERDRHVIYIDASLAAMAFMFALETLGLSSCPINWPDIEALEGRMQRLLGLDADERVVMVMAVGYADRDGMVAFSQKKPLREARSYNRLNARNGGAAHA